MNKVKIYTDGGARGNGTKDALGAIGVVLMDDNGNRKEVKKAYLGTTNNIMELTAAVEGLKLLREPCEVTLYSDSAYLVNAFNQRWVEKWQRNGWRTANKEPVKNKEIWKELIDLMKIHEVMFVKVKGHSDDENNEACDRLVNEAMDEYLGEQHE